MQNTRVVFLFVVTDADEVAGDAEGGPRDVEPAVAGEELVGEGVGLQVFHEWPELGWVFGADVGSTALKVLGVSDTAHAAVHVGIAETGIDDDGTADGLAGRLKQITATINHVCNLLNGGIVLGVLLPIAEFREHKVFREFDIFHTFCCLNCKTFEFLNTLQR